MHRFSAAAPCGLAGLILFLVTTTVQPAPRATHVRNQPANRQLGTERLVTQRPEPGGPSILHRGIQSYGVGAVRVGHAAASLHARSLERASMSQDPSLLTVTRKLSGSPMAGSVTAFRVSPDGATAVFIADKAPPPPSRSAPASSSGQGMSA